MLLYVHVPFCVQKCGYCAFHSGPFSPVAAARFTGLVLREIGLWSERLGRKNIETLYFGGGTPSLLDPAHLHSIVAELDRRFVISNDAEITLEANPESVTADGFLRAARAIGFNRLSLGVQSMQDGFLHMLGRPHSSTQVREAVLSARNAGFENLSMDLIWGLPGQDVAMWEADLAAAVALEPKHLSCYGLTLEPGTVLTQRVQNGQLTLPDEETGARMYTQGSGFLESQGYTQYEISNFAHPGWESQHNQGYWSGRDYLGLGPSAVSTLDMHRWTNPDNLEGYAKVVETGTCGSEREVLTEDTLRIEMVMLSLRTRRGLDLDKFKATTGMDFPFHHPTVEQLCSGGLVIQKSGHIQLTPNGMLVSNSVIELFLETLDDMHEKTGHL